MGAHKILFMTGVLFTVFLLVVKGEETERPRRYFWDLGYMLYKVADLNLWELAKLNFHGNYCGWGGSGIPVNELDKCCMIHDKCYGKWKGHCGHFSFRGYKYSCPRKGYCKCTDTRRCGSEACRCDLDFSWCVKRHVGHLRG